MKNKNPAMAIFLLIFLASASACLAYHSRYSEMIIDCAAFCGSFFLVAEAVYKIMRSRASIFPWQMTRLFRVMIGVSIFTIHTLQLMR